jgi:multidrug resistance protein, MATE family
MPQHVTAQATTEYNSLTHRNVLLIALPIIFSNATVPLVGFADAAVIGQLGEAHLLGAVALASNLFSFLYFLFGFLRMGTTGLTAQAAGADNRGEIAANLVRPLVIAGLIGTMMIVLQGPIIMGSLSFFNPSEAVSGVAKSYFDVRIWAAPAGLANFALIGWFIGLGRAGTTFYLQLLLNGLNIGFAILFVLVFDWGVPGVGLAALLAEYIAAAAGVVIALRELRRRSASTTRAAVLDITQLKRLFAVSRDIMIRTACLQIAFVFFVAQGAQAGDLTLAANAVLHSMMMITVYMIDGFAYAAETLVGRAIGARRKSVFRSAIRLTTAWAFGLSALLTVALFVGGALVIDLMTTSAEVRAAARVYLIWAALTPITSIWCFQLDGIYIGATETRTMRNMMLVALAIYFAAWAVFTPMYGNHGLWMAMHVLFLARAVLLAWALPGIERRNFPEPATSRPIPAMHA